MNNQRNILITGGRGYLATRLIDKLESDSRVGQIGEIDVKNKGYWKRGKVFHLNRNVNDSSLWSLMRFSKTDTVVHTAWTFNPTHDLWAQYRLDIDGTKNVLAASLKSGVVQNIVYLGSTTCYGQFAGNPSQEPFLKEEDWNRNISDRKKSRYPYSRHKAIIDDFLQSFALTHPEINLFWVRAAIVLGPNTNNIVSYIAKSPFTLGKFMFKVRGYDPPMQFLSEYDMTNILFRAVMERWSGVANAAGDGVLKYSEVIRLLDRKQVEMPAGVLYPLCESLWNLRLLKFPSALIDLIRYPWVADISLLKEKFGYRPLYSSVDALNQFKFR